jgi:hypothetical protein
MQRGEIKTLGQTPKGTMVTITATVIGHDESNGKVVLRISGVGGSGEWQMPQTTSAALVCPGFVV